MNEEEKKAIEDSKEIINELNNRQDRDFIGRLYYKNIPIEDTLQILLNLISKQQEEIELRDKVIHEMAKNLNGAIWLKKEVYCKQYTEHSPCGFSDSCLRCLKKYFINKAKEEM